MEIRASLAFEMITSGDPTSMLDLGEQEDPGTYSTETCAKTASVLEDLALKPMMFMWHRLLPPSYYVTKKGERRLSSTVPPSVRSISFEE